MTEHLYIARPPAGGGAGILALHAWWGFNPFFKSFCDRLAGEGFLVAAPDLYHGAVAATIPEAENLRSKLKQKIARQEITEAAAELAAMCQPKPVGLVGFSLGGYFALWLAEQGVERLTAVVIFYGSRGGDYSRCPAAFQFHLAENDPYESESGIRKLEKSLKAAGKTAEFYRYPGTTHWFFESDREGAYDPQAVRLAWERTAGFFKKHLK